MVDVDVFQLISFGFLAGVVAQIIIVSHICWRICFHCTSLLTKMSSILTTCTCITADLWKRRSCRRKELSDVPYVFIFLNDCPICALCAQFKLNN